MADVVKHRLTELLKTTEVSDLAEIFDEIFSNYDWLMQYLPGIMSIEEIEQEEDETDKDYEDRIRGTKYEICESFCNKCDLENTPKIIDIAVARDKVVEFWDLFLGVEYIGDFDDFVETFYRDMHGKQNFTQTQLNIVKEVIELLREEG